MFVVVLLYLFYILYFIESQESDICSKLEKKVATEIERRWHERFNQQKLDSDLQIMRLQQQLSNISAQLNETKRMHQQFALMNHSPIVSVLNSNQTQRISSYSNKSRMSMKALSDRDEDPDDNDEYNTSEDEHIEYNANESIQSREERQKRESVINISDSPICRIFNIPSNPYLFNSYSNHSRVSQSRTSSVISSKRASPSLPAIKTKINGYNPLGVDIPSVTFGNNKNEGDIRCTSNAPNKSRTDPMKLCDAKVENAYLKRKETRNEESFLCTLLSQYTCFNLKTCWRTTGGLTEDGGVENINDSLIEQISLP